MYFPLKRKFVGFSNDSNSYKNINLNDEFEIPEDNHVGAFGYKRKNHIHEGIDFYCNDGESIYSIEDGVVVSIGWFTGSAMNSNWWNDTQYIMIEGKSGVINYGEIIVNPYIQIGSKILAGSFLGTVRQVLKENKGRPMSMLHLELYTSGTKTPIKEWGLNMEKPNQLLNPLTLFKNF